jgi:hypothetical protein
MSLRRLLLIAFFLLMAVIFARYFSYRARYGLDLFRPRRTMTAQVEAARNGDASPTARAILYSRDPAARPAARKRQPATASGPDRGPDRNGGLTAWPG